MDSKASPRRQRVSAEERSRFVSLYRASGLTQAAFARQQGLKLPTFQQWVYRCGPKKKVQARFQELRVGSLLPSAWLAEIVVDSGMTLRLTGPAHPDWICSVVRALRQKPC